MLAISTVAPSIRDRLTAKNRGPLGAPCRRVGIHPWVEEPVPVSLLHQTVKDGAQGAACYREAEQRDQQPAQPVVLLPTAARARCRRCQVQWEWQQPAQPVPKAVQVEAMQSQRPAGAPARRQSSCFWGEGIEAGNKLVHGSVRGQKNERTCPLFLCITHMGSGQLRFIFRKSSVPTMLILPLL